MCGIAGLINYTGGLSADALRQAGHAMRKSLTHRGPDDHGLWADERGLACLAHQRLSILDLRPEGAQPMVSQPVCGERTAGPVVLSFNGEIYNYKRLRQKLIEAGHHFHTETDSEVLLHLLEEFPPDEAISQLRGMFGFAAWYPKRRELVLARDPFGKKPLYYAQGGGLFAFASELQALQLLGEEVAGPVDPLAVQEYLLLQYVHAPRAINRNVRKLEPGSFLRVSFEEDGQAVMDESAEFTGGTPVPLMDVPSVLDGRHRHFAFDANSTSVEEFDNEDQAVEALREILIEAVRLRMVADVPLGAFLSSGVDSALVVAIMAKELNSRVKTFSVGFADSPDSEHLGAREIAEHLGVDHHELMIEPSGVDMLGTITAALDEPNGDSSCLPVWLLSEFTRRHVTVALSGDGGDEMFGGYNRYTDALAEATDPLRQLRSLRRDRRFWSRGRAYVGGRVMLMPERLVEPMTGPLHPEVQELINGWRRMVNDRKRPLIHAMRTLDAATYLPGAVLAKVDRMSMQHSLEVRCPLLDVELAKWAARLPAEYCHDGRTTKRLLRRLLVRYLPQKMIDRPKKGFGLPEKMWSKPRLLEMADDLLLSSDARTRDFLDTNGVRRFLHNQARPGCFSIYQVWALLVLEQWLRDAAEPIAMREVA